jgi:hypothetical protein
MDLNPPIGSSISIRRGEQGPLIIIPAKGSPSRYLGGLFLLFWLGAWTVGAVLAAYTAFRIFRPSVPETLLLKRSGIDYDAGIPPLELNTYQKRKNYWGSVFAKRLRTELGRQELISLRLRETEEGNRLTIDIGAKRVELASQASEVEREWLGRLLADRYALPQVMPGAAGKT